MGTEFKYWAFISYSHTDKKWGDWLHKALETYKVPKALIGSLTLRGEPVPARVYPIFRDRDELPTNDDLGVMIHRALEQSRYLIVVCSPRSARSQWVDKEILEFKKLGRENRVLAIIVAGEPNASANKPGADPAAECFPPALRFKLGADGQLSSERTEPIAADARDQGDGKTNSLLKLLAGVMGVDYDALKRRDEARRRHRQRLVISASVALVLIFATLAGAALWQWREAVIQKKEADTQRLEAERQKHEVQVVFSKADCAAAIERVDDHQDAEAIAYLCRALRSNPHNQDAAALLFSVLSTRDWMVPEGLFQLDDQESFLAFDPNGQFALSLKDTTARIWDVTGHQVIREIPDFAFCQFPAASFLPDGRHIVLCISNVLQKFDIDTGLHSPLGQGEALPAPMMQSRRPSRPIAITNWSADGRYYLGVSQNTVQVWNTTAQAPETVPLHAPDWVIDAWFSPDGRRIIAVVMNRSEVNYNSDEWGLTMYALNPSRPAIKLKSPDEPKTMMLWDARPAASSVVAWRQQPWVLDAKFSPDDRWIVTTSGNAAQVWDATTHELKSSLAMDDVPVCAVFSPDSQRLLLVSDNHTARVWDLVTGQPTTPLIQDDDEVNYARDHYTHGVTSVGFTASPHPKRSFSGAFSPDGKSVAVAIGFGVQIWDAATGSPILKEPLRQKSYIQSVCFSPDGHSLLTSSLDANACLWDVATGKLIDPPMYAGADIRAAAFSPDGEYIVLAVGEFTAQVWSVRTHKVIASIRQDDPVKFAKFSPDNKSIIIVSTNTAQVWDGLTGKAISAPMRHVLPITSVMFSHDGNFVLTSSEDKTARVWSITTGQAVSVPMTHNAPVNVASFSADERSIVTADDDGTIEIWPFHPASPPSWMLDLAESLGGCSLDSAGNPSYPPGKTGDWLRQQANQETNKTDAMVLWARQALKTDGPKNGK